MAGIYIHVPFCKQACNYCNFYFSTSLFFKEAYINAILKEIEIQKNYLHNQELTSIYWGGGTPSLLNTSEIALILKKIQKEFSLSPNAEITLEANPDDLSKEKLQAYFDLGINRLSIGTQSFDEKDLQYMNRAHSALEAENCIKDAYEVGFQTLSIDLIYGVPGQTLSSWENNLQKVIDLKVNHLSCYALTVEENTPLFHQIRKGKAANVDENLAAEHFALLQAWAEKEAWLHYEISNLCKNQEFSKHNTSYWEGQHYLGLGPAAHSYNGTSRQWNIPNLKKYTEALQEGTLAFELETLTKANVFNETVMTQLRTYKGIDKSKLAQNFPDWFPLFEKELAKINPLWIHNTKENLVLTKEGKFYADGIAAQLFIDENE